MFLDEATITVTGGSGGNGCVSWRREKYVPRGGPDGGDGGDGGSVFIQADPNTDTLSLFRSVKKFKAFDGTRGGGQRKHGKNGNDLLLAVPPGTYIKEGGTMIADLKEAGEEMMVVRGGRGGFGNAHFCSATRQRPDFAETGEPGESKILHLELKLVADVGIIGLPSAGKSTLISVISSAKPKIADYPFTTLVPNLGVVEVAKRSFVVCDVPGLIEKASEGKGLGHKFLKHIERCGILLHLLDLSRAITENGIDESVLVADYKTIRKELEAYSDTLAAKRELVVINKADLTTEKLDSLTKSLRKKKVPVDSVISAATKKNVLDLLKKILPIVIEHKEHREEEPEESLPVLSPQQDDHKMGAFKLIKEKDGTIRVKGKRAEQFTNMTNFNAEGALLRFKDVMERSGIKRAALRERGEADAKIYIGDVRVDLYL